MAYDSIELKQAAFAVLEEDVVTKLVFKRNNNDLFEIDLSGVGGGGGGDHPDSHHAGLAPLSSPTFTGFPLAPSQAWAGDGLTKPSMGFSGDPDTGWGQMPGVADNGNMALISNGRYAMTIEIEGGPADGVPATIVFNSRASNRLALQSGSSINFHSASGHFEFESNDAAHRYENSIYGYRLGTAQASTIVFGTDGAVAQACPLGVRMPASPTVNAFEVRNAADVVITRITSTGAFDVIAPTSTTTVNSGRVVGDTQDRWRIDAGGRLWIGPGNAVPNPALFLNASVGVGRFTLENVTTGTDLTAIGLQAMRYNQGGSFNTAIGSAALVNNVSGQQNVAIGSLAAAALTGSYNVAIGSNALYNATSDSNVAVGTQALQNLTSGAPNTAVGSQALQLLTTGAYNTAIGQNAMHDATTATYCVAVGQDAGQHITTAMDCTAIGEAALVDNTTGYGNTAVGHGALRDNTTGAGNVAMGVVTLQSTNTDNNTALGCFALQSATGGSYVALGFRAGTTPNDVGANATTTGTRQTLIGTITGQSSPTQVDDIVCVGFAALAGGNGAVALGANANAGHASSVALGMSTPTTAPNQVAIATRHIEMTEIADPAAPAVNNARLFVRDNGAGKTQVCVRFATGAVQVLLTEP